MHVQRAWIGKRHLQKSDTIFVDRGGDENRIDLWCHITHRDRRAPHGHTAPLVANSHLDIVGVDRCSGRVVVQILVRSEKKALLKIDSDGLHRRAVAPIDVDHVRVLGVQVTKQYQHIHRRVVFVRTIWKSINSRNYGW